MRLHTMLHPLAASPPGLRRTLSTCTLVWAWAILLAGVPAAQAQSRYTVSADGQEVTDAQTALVWRRCAEGLAWNDSTCAGTLRYFNHEAALAHARDQAGWRLPNVKELETLVDKARTASPFIDVLAFPGTLATSFWTSTPYTANPSRAWGVYFYSGGVGNDSRGGDGAVRLVRASL